MMHGEIEKLDHIQISPANSPAILILSLILNLTPIIIAVLHFYSAGLHFRRAEIGIIVMVCALPASFILFTFTSLGHWITELYVSYVISDFTLSAIYVAPFSALATVGLMLYIVGREEFWHYLRKEQKVSTFVTILGMIQIIWSAYFAFATYSILGYYASKPSGEPFSNLLADFSPYFLMPVLLIISGILLLVDARNSKWSEEGSFPLVKYATK